MSRSRKRKHTNYYNQPKFSDVKKKATKPVISYSLSQEITKDKSPEVKRNTFGDIIYSMQYIGDEKYEYWIEYDECRRPISYKNSRGYSWNCKYNSKGNISSFWDYTGYQEDYKYYARNLVICTTSFGEKIKKRVIADNPITRNMFITSEDYI